MIGSCDGWRRDAHRVPGPIIRCADGHGLLLLCRSCWSAWNSDPAPPRRWRR